MNEKLYSGLTSAFRVALSGASWFLTVMMSLFVVKQMEGNLSHLPAAAYYPLLVLFIFLMFLVVGYKLFQFVEYSLFLARTEGFKKDYVIILFAVSMLRLVCAGSFSFMVRGETASFFVEENKDGLYNSKIQEITGQRLSEVEKAKEDKQRAESSEADRIAKVKKQWKADYQAAINSGTPDQVRSWKASKETGTWLMNSGKKNKDYAKRVLEAKNALSSLIESERAKTAQYSDAYSAVSSDKLLISEIEELQRQRSAKQVEIKEDLAKKKSYIFLLDFGCVFFGFLFTYFLASVRVASKVELDTRTIFSAISLVFNSWEKRLIYWIEKWAKKDLDGDGHTGTPPTNTNTLPSGEDEDSLVEMLRNTQVEASRKEDTAALDKARKEALDYNKKHHNPAASEYLRNRDNGAGMNGHGHNGEDGKKKVLTTAPILTTDEDDSLLLREIEIDNKRREVEKARQQMEAEKRQQDIERIKLDNKKREIEAEKARQQKDEEARQQIARQQELDNKKTVDSQRKRKQQQILTTTKGEGVKQLKKADNKDDDDLTTDFDNNVDEVIRYALDNSRKGAFVIKIGKKDAQVIEHKAKDKAGNIVVKTFKRHRIISMMGTLRKRLASAIEKQNKASEENNSKWLAYWESRLVEFKT
jgi:hypothetical protein